MMNDSVLEIPSIYSTIEKKTREIGFSMSSDKYVGSLLKTLVASKPNGHFLEIGTGTGLALAWILDGVDPSSKIISIDNDLNLIKVASGAFNEDPRVHFICADGEQWIKEYNGVGFDLIFADAWPGKYSIIEKALDMLNPGGFYVIDDMLPQSGWPNGHQKANNLINYLENRDDLYLTKMNWSTGIIIATKV